MTGTFKGTVSVYGGRHRTFRNGRKVTLHKARVQSLEGEEIKILVESPGHLPIVPDYKIVSIHGPIVWFGMPGGYAFLVRPFLALGLTLGTVADLEQDPILTLTGNLNQVLDDPVDFDVWNLDVEVARRVDEPPIRVMYATLTSYNDYDTDFHPSFKGWTCNTFALL